MSLINELQKQISYLLVDSLEKRTIAEERITYIARRIEMLLPESLSDQQVINISPEIESIPELSNLPLVLSIKRHAGK